MSAHTLGIAAHHMGSQKKKMCNSLPFKSFLAQDSLLQSKCHQRNKNYIHPLVLVFVRNDPHILHAELLATVKWFYQLVVERPGPRSRILRSDWSKRSTRNVQRSHINPCRLDIGSICHASQKDSEESNVKKLGRQLTCDSLHLFCSRRCRSFFFFFFLFFFFFVGAFHSYELHTKQEAPLYI